MREFRRKPVERASARLQRGADGRIRPAGRSGNEIADIWAEQRRIRLAEAIAADQRKKEKKEYGRTARLRQKFQTIRSRKLPMSRWSSRKRLGLSIALVLVVALLGLFFLPNTASEGDRQPKVTTNVLDASSQQPTYATVLPAGKSVEQLGGWVRVSPPDKDPVFAFVDTVNGVQLNVSQQPLPPAFRQDMAGEMTKLAKQFNATQSLAVDGAVIYIGTSEKGPQSAILAKNDLLILIKSSQKLTDDQWAAYTLTLQP